MTALEKAGLALLVKDAVCVAINGFFWFRSPAEWVTFCETRPRYAALVKIPRALGIEPTRLLEAFADFMRNQTGKRSP